MAKKPAKHAELKVIMPDDPLPRAAKDRAPDPMVEYLSELLLPWGGPRGFAAHWKEVFDTARKGSPTQLRALEKIVDILKMLHDLTPKRLDLDELSESELKAELLLAMNG